MIKISRILCFCLLTFFLCAIESNTAAHPLRFGLLDITERGDGILDVFFKFSGTEKKLTGAFPILPEHCKPVGRKLQTTLPNGNSMEFTAQCGEYPLVGSRIRVQGIEEPGLQVLLRVEFKDGRDFQTMLNTERSSVELPAPEETPPVFQYYILLGIKHILSGADHLMFVLALVLLVRRQRKLIRTVTAFTVGHSVTLSLAALELVSVPAPPVEAVIAMSIVLLASELLRNPSAPSTLTRRHPEFIAAGFGLFHGLGFARALGEIGLPQGAIPLALFGFNVGVEIGQLIFIGALLPAFALLGYTKVQWPGGTRHLLPYAIGSFGAFLCITRVVGFFF